MYSFNLTSTDATKKRIALVRNEIDDVTEAASPVAGKDFFVSDERIHAFLISAQDEAPDDANEVEVRLMACAAILDTLATNQAYILKKQRTMEDETDGPAVGKEIRSHAARCAARALASLKSRREAAAEALLATKQYEAPSATGFGLEVRF